MCDQIIHIERVGEWMPGIWFLRNDWCGAGNNVLASARVTDCPGGVDGIFACVASVPRACEVGGGASRVVPSEASAGATARIITHHSQIPIQIDVICGVHR